MKKFLIIFFLSFGLAAYAQNSRTFILINADTEQVIPFANVLFSKTNYKGTSTDIDGVFYVPSAIETMIISYVGYETMELSLSQVDSNIIKLKPQVSELDEVVINGENPAHRIIRNAVLNKRKNNPESLNSFTYESYDKIVLTLGKSNNTTKRDTLRERLDSVMKGSHLFITETIAKHKYLYPRFSEDSIIATKSSGLKNPKFALLANSFQPFSFYEDYINLFDINFLNPISKGSTRKYKFRLKENYLQGKDTIFVISFEPKANRNFEGLKGLLKINSNNYAVQSVDATTFNSGKLDITIQQKYTLLNNTQWFPEQLNFQITIGQGLGNMTYIGKSYLSKIQPNAPLTKKDFPFVSITLPETAGLKDEGFWKLNRRYSLNKQEQRTYVFIDSIGEKVNLDRTFDLLPSLLKGRYPFKYVDLDLTKIVSVNEYEGPRFGLGFYTNDDLLKHISFGAYAGYGFGDKVWKYGGDLLVEFPGQKDITLNLNYTNDLRETGVPSDNRFFNSLSPRNWMANQMDGIELFGIQTKMKIWRNFNWTIGLNTADVTPLYDYTYLNNATALRDYTNTELNIGIGYHVNEELLNNFGLIYRIPNDAPVFNLLYSRGLKGTLAGDFSYNKLRFTLDHSFRTRALGKTTYRLDLGYIDNSLPIGLMFTGEGSLDRKIPFVIRNYFQTVKPYEFISNKYAHLFTVHNFGRLFNNKGNIQPDVVLHNNFGIGSLIHPEHHQQIDFSTKEELFLETGLELKNLYRIDFMDFGYLGLGVGGFYRYGYHNLGNFNDDFALKFSLGFTFK